MTPDEAIKIVEQNSFADLRFRHSVEVLVAEVKRLREDQKIAQVALHMAMDAILSEHPLSPETISAVTAQITYAYRHNLVDHEDAKAELLQPATGDVERAREIVKRLFGREAEPREETVIGLALAATRAEAVKQGAMQGLQTVMQAVEDGHDWCCSWKDGDRTMTLEVTSMGTLEFASMNLHQVEYHAEHDFRPAILKPFIDSGLATPDGKLLDDPSLIQWAHRKIGSIGRHDTDYSDDAAQRTETSQ